MEHSPFPFGGKPQKRPWQATRLTARPRGNFGSVNLDGVGAVAGAESLEELSPRLVVLTLGRRRRL
jgi:hypothetical protein